MTEDEGHRWKDREGKGEGVQGVWQIGEVREGEGHRMVGPTKGCQT